jgi:serine/threonine protein phosphatase PrpC
VKRFEKSVEDDVEQILIEEQDSLVLLVSEGFYSIVNKRTHFVKLVDDEDVGELLVLKLRERNIDVFNDYSDFTAKYPKQLERPMFWPADKPWPPK